MIKSFRPGFNKAITVISSPHFWAITFLTAIAGTVYYYELGDLKWLPFDFSFLSNLSAYHVDYLLFLPPMLYAAGIFGVRGSLVSSAVIFVIILPRELRLPTWPLFTLMPIFWSIFTMAAILLGREKAERQRIRASEARYRDLFDSASDAIIISDMEGKIIEANQAAAKLTGYGREQLSRMNIRETISPEHVKLVVEKEQDLLKNRDAIQPYELEMITKDGTRRNVESMPRLIIQKGQPTGIQTILRDVTERRQMEVALRKSEAMYRSLVEGSLIGIVILDLEGRFTFVNQGFSEAVGWSQAEMFGKLFADFIYPDDRPTVMNIFNNEFVATQDNIYFNFRIINREGHTVYLGAAASVIKVKGEPVGFNTVTIDMTDRQRMESALRDSEEFSSSLLLNSPYPVVVVNPDSSIRYVNPALEKLTGFTAAELIGKKPPYPWWPEETLEKTSQDLQKTISNEATKVEQLFRTKNGERFWVEITSIAVKREGEFKYNVAAWVDITERKRLRENMQFYISEITRAQEEERKRIARELHDDTAQSLALLLINTDVILQHKLELPDDIIRRLVELRQEINGTMENLRRFSRELRPDILDQAGLVSALELLTQDLMNTGGIDAYLDLQGEERRLSADAELLMFRIAQEAMHNIRKHSQATEARVVVEFTRETARLTVNDNGKGFEVPDELGDFASQGRLGIVGMRERARLLNANFSVRSEVGKGTTLIVELAI